MDKKFLASVCFGVLLLIGTISSQPAHAEMQFSLKFGTSGSTDSGLKNPTSIFVSGDGKQSML